MAIPKDEAEMAALIEAEKKKWEQDAAKEDERKQAELTKKLSTTLKEQYHKDLDAAKSSLAERQKELDDINSKMAELQKANEELLKGKGNEEIDALKKVAAEKEELLKISETRAKALVEKMGSEFKATLEKKDLDLYKQRKIAEANGKIIPGLVVGNTLEEIDAAIETSKSEYSKISENAIKAKDKNDLDSSIIPGSTLSGEIIDETIKSREDIARMSKDQFNEYEQKLLAQYLK